MVRIQLYVITQTNNRHHRTKFQRDLSSDHNYPVQKIAALIHVRQRYNAVSELQLDGIHLQKRGDILGLTDFLRRRFLFIRFMLNLRRLNGACHNSADHNKDQSKTDEHHFIKRRDKTQKRKNHAYQIEHLRHTEKLADQHSTEIRLFGALCHQNTCGKGNKQGRDLADQAVTNSQNGIFVKGVPHLQALTEHTECNTAHDIDEGDNQTRRSVSLNVLHGTVHGTEEACFLLDLFTASFRLFIRDGAGI